MADGSPKTVTKALEVSISLVKETIRMAFLVIPNILDKIIFGIDFPCEIRSALICSQVCLQLSLLPASRTRINTAPLNTPNSLVYFATWSAPTEWERTRPK